MQTSVITRTLVSAGVVLVATMVVATRTESQTSLLGPTEAPTGFVVASNGFAEEFCAQTGIIWWTSPNSPMIPDDECDFETAAEEFTGPESIADGLGPIFNAAGCGECHLTPILGGSSQITEKRAGFFDGAAFFEHPGGSLIHDRAIPPSLQELTMPARTNVTAIRSSVSVLGDGFVEAIRSATLEDIASHQPSSMRGLLIRGAGGRGDRNQNGPLWLEEPAGQPRLVLGRRLRERDGHHQPAAAG